MRDCLGIIEQSSKKASDYQQKGAVPFIPFCMSKLAEQHGNKLIRGGETRCMSLSFMFHHQTIKMIAVKKSN